MNLFAPGLREARRLFDRQINRFSLLIARRNLAAAEYDLGLLGWQQADFEGDAQRHIDQLTDVERQQSKLTNESAGIGQAIRELHAQRAAERERYEETLAQLEERRDQAAAPVDDAERHLAARRKNSVDFDGLIAELDRELAGVRELYEKLRAVEVRTPQMSDEVLRLRNRTVEIPHAQDDLRKRRVQAANDIRALEEKLARGRSVLSAAEEALRKLHADFDKADDALGRQIAVRERRKQGMEKQSEDLESAKGKPYRQIGQILADSGIAPMNQPQALEAVHRRRAIVVRLAKAIASSIEASGHEDRAVLRKSALAWAAVALLMGFAAWGFLR